MHVNLSGKKHWSQQAVKVSVKPLPFILQEGADVMLSGRHEQTLQEAVKELSPLVKGS